MAATDDVGQPSPSFLFPSAPVNHSQDDRRLAHKNYERQQVIPDPLACPLPSRSSSSLLSFPTVDPLHIRLLISLLTSPYITLLAFCAFPLFHPSQLPHRQDELDRHLRVSLLGTGKGSAAGRSALLPFLESERLSRRLHPCLIPGRVPNASRTYPPAQLRVHQANHPHSPSVLRTLQHIRARLCASAFRLSVM